MYIDRYNLDIIFAFFFLISSISFFLFFNVDNDKSLAFLRSLRSRQFDWNHIQKKKIASLRCWHEVRRSEICTRSAGRKKISHDSIFKRREETKSHFVLFEKKKDLFERKENRVETIDYYSRNFLFSRVVIIALIQKVERSLLYFLRASVISFEIRESKQFFSRARRFLFLIVQPVEVFKRVSRNMFYVFSSFSPW